MSAPLGKLVDIGGGRRLHLVACGSGSPTVVFESGGAGGISIQDMPVQRMVSPFTRAVVYDRAGLGWSDPAPAGRSFEERVADLHAALALTEPPPYVLVGLSFGGLLARVFARRYPHEVAGMVLVDGGDAEKYFATMVHMRAFHERQLRDEIKAVESGELRRRLEKALVRARWFNATEKAAILDVVPRAGHYRTGLDEFSAIDRTPDAMKRPGGFGTLGDRPLIVLGRGVSSGGAMSPWDEGYAESQARLAALSTNSANFIAAGIGHSIALQHPRLVAAAIAAVVAAVKSGPLDTGEVARLAAEGAGD